jgi:tRNA-splicing ligase RtcB (3'-phosphate/5'-hydroxy nucleic acid ligase)
MPRWEGKLNKIDDYRWEIPMSYKPGMRVPGMVYADAKMIETIKDDHSLEQVANVAFLPGIVGHSLAMPDIHWGYGFPIGGVAATRVSDGVVSPGGVGYDINCGVRLLRTNLSEAEVRPKIRELVNHLFHNVPTGLGTEGKIKVSDKEMNEVLTEGAHWAVKQGFGLPCDLEVTEETGRLKNADPSLISSRAKQRGTPQSGTLGSGNHFLEVQVVREIYDREAAKVLGINDIGQVLVLIHTGSRGFGHQTCEDFLKIMIDVVRKYNIILPDRQLVCAPVESKEGKDYLSAMACAANYAWANRQCIAHWTRESFIEVFGKKASKLGLEQIYDVAHNIAKIEEYTIDGQKLKLCVHRKGATRSFPPGHPDIPQQYKSIGQPVLIPGDMGRRSYIALGTEKAMMESFGSTCHGAGRLQSRGAAKRSLKGINIAERLEARGIIVKARNMRELAEEASEAYKDVTQVVEVTHKAGISRKVVMAEPMGTIKG